MANIKPSDHGIVVENKDTGLRYASLDVNFDPKTERKVRDLRSGETVMSYTPRQAGPIGGSDDDSSAGDTLDGTDTGDTVDGQ